MNTPIMKILTYNLFCDRIDFLNYVPSICEFIRNQNPDIISLQEVRIDSYDIIIKNFPEYNYYVDWQVRYNRLYGELILVKYELLEGKYFPFTNSQNLRGLTLYKLSDFYVATTHLERKNCDIQMNTIMSILPKNDRVILMGDFNFDDIGQYPNIMNFTEILTQNTFVSKTIKYRPDRIFLKGFTCINVTVHTECTLSDHFCISANIIEN